MRNKNTKTTLFMYSTYECSAVEEYLEMMAEKGWILQSVRRSSFKFMKTEKRKIKYSVDVLDRVSIFDHNDSDVALEYREYCKRAGWTYVCEDGGTQIFYTDSESEIVSIHTDEQEKFKVVFKSSIKNVYWQIILIIIFIRSLYMQLTTQTESLASNFGDFLLVAMFSLILMNCIEIINFYIWVVKAKVRLKENKLMPYNSYKQLKRKNILIKAYNLILMLIFLVLAVSERSKFNIPMAIIMLVSIIIIGNVKRCTDKKDYTKDSNMGIYIGSTIIVIVVASVLGSIFGYSTNINHSEAQAKSAGLTFLDLGYKKNEDKNSPDYKNSYIEFDKSILAERTKYSYSNGGNSFQYTVFESKHPLLIKLQENSVLNRYKKYLKFKQEKTNLPSNIKAYFGVNNSNLITLVSEDKVIFIMKNLSISQEEFLNIVYKKLLSK